MNGKIAKKIRQYAGRMFRNKEFVVRSDVREKPKWLPWFVWKRLLAFIFVKQK